MLTRRPFLSVSLVLSRHTDLCLPRSVFVCLRCGPRPESWTDTRAASPMDISLALRVFHLRLAVRHPPLCYSHGSLHQSLHRVHRQVGGNYALDQRGVAAESAESIASLAARSGATGKRFPVYKSILRWKVPGFSAPLAEPLLTAAERDQQERSGT